MKMHVFRRFFNLLILMIFLTGCAGAAVPDSPEPVVSPGITAIVDRYRAEILQRMQQGHIPGLAIAVVDDQGILWEESFGVTDWDSRTPVTPATLFSIQSMSKSFTATAAMFAAQEGLVDLDAPITTYLPDFSVHSIFEERPEQKMTMRILLSHTAGFPHDPGYGGNADGKFGVPSYSFEKHIASISETWLMFPVGSRYSYSNIGIDLAGYILQARSGMSFIQYVQKKILDPLGMRDSTLDYQRVRADPARAIGHIGVPLRPPVDFQLLPSGGVWTSVEDMARYMRFHLNKGALDGNRLLREDLAETMYTPPNAAARGAYSETSYALGITVNQRNGALHFQHGGGGFGFNASMVWYPELKLGSVVLTNFPQPDAYCVQLSENVLDSLIASDIPLYRQRYLSAISVTPAYPPDWKGYILTDAALRDLIASKALPEDAAARQRRSEAVGTYVTTSWGIPEDTIEISEKDGKLTWTYHGDMMISSSTTLTEVQPGLFFSTEGNLVDLRDPARLLDNVRLFKADPQNLAVRTALYGLFGMVFFTMLFFWPARALRRKKAANHTAARATESRWLVAAGILATLASFLGLICLALIALVPNLIYVPWPLPFVDLTWWQFALVGLPFANLALAIGVFLAAALALRSPGRVRLAGWYFLAVGLALLAFHLLLISVGFCASCNPGLPPMSPPAPNPTLVPSIHLKDCFLGNTPAQCGTLRVYEDRATRQGRLIDLQVAVIKSQDPNPAPDPIFYLAGGPGGSAISHAPYAMQVLKSALRRRDLVLVDQRGTGGSNSLTCPRAVEESLGLVPLDEAMIRDLRECLANLNGDPAAYTTAWSMDDLDDVRAALGYDRINLYGESYGPTAEQVYLQRHGEHVRTMTLEGVTLLDVPMFEQMPRGSQAALDRVLTRCQADPTCQAAYPNLRAELNEVLARFDEQPVELRLTNPRTGSPYTLSRAMLSQGIHSLLVDTESAVMLPHLIHQLYQGKLDEITTLTARSLAAGTYSPVWKIMNLTILCHEDWARLRPAETARYSQGSFMDYADVRQYTVPEPVCAELPRPRPEALYPPLTTSTVPVLIISNQADPQNPPENVAGAREHYPNSLTIIAPGQGHGYTGIVCRETFISAFIDAGTTQGLDTRCLESVPLPPFP